ncbi:MAG: hypothetical protein ACRDS1_05955 [Pseudonocardiaceae bacterium]
MSAGISPARSLAVYQALFASARLTCVHSVLLNAVIPIRTRYGLARLPCTVAVTAPVATLNSST